MKKIIISVLFLILIFFLVYFASKIAVKTEYGTIGSLMNVKMEDIDYITKNGIVINRDEFLGEYWYNVYISSEGHIDNVVTTNIYKAYDKNDSILFSFEETSTNYVVLVSKDNNKNIYKIK